MGPYALQAAIAACHARAATPEDTDWEGIAALYDALAQLVPSPVVELNRAVAVGRAFGPEAGLEIVEALEDGKALEGYHLLYAVRGDLLEGLGRTKPGSCRVRSRGVDDGERAGTSGSAEAGGGLSRSAERREPRGGWNYRCSPRWTERLRARSSALIQTMLCGGRKARRVTGGTFAQSSVDPALGRSLKAFEALWQRVLDRAWGAGAL